MRKKIVIITDTTSKQTNGVVRTMNKTMEILEQNFDVYVISPELFDTFKIPSYKEIEFAYNTSKLGSLIEKYKPDYIHISTEGPVGLAGKLYCDKKKYNYTTSYHSMFPEFFKDMFGFPAWISYIYFKWFHSKSKSVLVPTETVKDLLESKGFKNINVWSRGVDRTTFNSVHRIDDPKDKRVVLCVSRVSKEKGLDDFCELSDIYSWKLKDTKFVLVGDGPYLPELKQKYPNVTFLGKKVGEELSKVYANADLFVFPSKNDTFGLVMLEAISSGTPLLAYDTNGSREIIEHDINGYIVEDLTDIPLEDLYKLNRETVENTSWKWSWETCTKTFIENLIQK